MISVKPWELTALAICMLAVAGIVFALVRGSRRR
ncbi:hypothetical protein BJ971_004803 [Actinoplanes digitatis]|uniref:Uncharacterized protein n=1 Tax=Actinoplanes digitatis TaxID=1868 RepID=A0A7W7I0N5_9ACTN|nr:hypothetical protein [Actinoplanes digitatis]